MSFLICILHNRHEIHNLTVIEVKDSMAFNKKKANGNAGGSSDQGREVDVEVKNLLMDLVRQPPAIYDKSHPDHFRVNLRNEIWDKIGKILVVPSKSFDFYARSIKLLKL